MEKVVVLQAVTTTTTLMKANRFPCKNSADAAMARCSLPWWFDYGEKPAWWRPLSICSGDYLGKLPRAELGYAAHGTLKEKLLYRLKERGMPIDTIGRVELVTTPRLFGYAMNPASFYYCYERAEGDRPAERLCAFAVEVHNTFGETHLYAFDVARDRRAPSFC
ncbi:hypothetical protein SYNPS1DRAFT_26074 [Syncephalis pseudoplumigaleata]|uniref:Uncharacterized protein n=1 Tax=Syncephalis pseudoplumigaleata TaxID=1712513 RepID=A0A4P9YR19_9FUNG|nr:hypothetical protein SYNPS1DRAFT_26074 [Syncephalis pseudoplumigaleata]|eukprot:RKP22257.1 hypothetical protein SYNPS1DRAFT_26074 [Syncephalis pseudoplumigaleata]